MTEALIRGVETEPMTWLPPDLQLGSSKPCITPGDPVLESPGSRVPVS